jgi:hypothetical protein
MLLLFLDQVFEITDGLRLCNLDRKDAAEFIALDKAVEDNWYTPPSMWRKE